MVKRVYKPLEPVTYKECLEIISKGDEDDILLLPLRAGEFLEHWREAQDICIRLFENDSPAVRANAVLGLSYTARNHGKLDKRIVKPYLLKELRENIEYKERVIYSIQDINLFLKWNIGNNLLESE